MLNYAGTARCNGMDGIRMVGPARTIKQCHHGLHLCITIMTIYQTPIVVVMSAHTLDLLPEQSKTALQS